MLEGKQKPCFTNHEAGIFVLQSSQFPLSTYYTLMLSFFPEVEVIVCIKLLNAAFANDLFRDM